MAKKNDWLTSASKNIKSNYTDLVNDAYSRLKTNSKTNNSSNSGTDYNALDAIKNSINSLAVGATGSALGSITGTIKDAVSGIAGNAVKAQMDPIAQKVKDYADLLNKYGLGPGGGSGSSSSSSGGGYAAPNRIDIQPMIDAFTNAANARKNTLQTTANQARSDLLNSIKRFQEDTARSQEIQRDAFNASRADLEEAAFQADRANRISAAARGIGGSGLQQLSQLQTLMQQNNAISDLAGENTDVQMKLAENLARYEEDANTEIQNLMANLANSLSEIDASLGDQIANLRYTEDARYEEARQAAMENAMNRAQSQRSYENSVRNSYAQALLDYELGLREQAEQEANYGDLVKNLQSDFSDKISSITDTTALEEELKGYKDELYNLVHDNLISNDVYTSGLAYLNNAYNSRLNSINDDSSNSSFSDWISSLFGGDNVKRAEEQLRQQARAKGLI